MEISSNRPSSEAGKTELRKAKGSVVFGPKLGALLRLGFEEDGREHARRSVLSPRRRYVSHESMIDQLQIRDSFGMYNSIVERCFNDCVDTFDASPWTSKRKRV